MLLHHRCNPVINQKALHHSLQVRINLSLNTSSSLHHSPNCQLSNLNCLRSQECIQNVLVENYIRHVLVVTFKFCHMSPTPYGFKLVVLINETVSMTKGNLIFCLQSACDCVWNTSALRLYINHPTPDWIDGRLLPFIFQCGFQQEFHCHCEEGCPGFLV